MKKKKDNFLKTRLAMSSKSIEDDIEKLMESVVDLSVGRSDVNKFLFFQTKFLFYF